MYFDTHAHYDDKRFAEDADELLKHVYEAGVTLVVNAACDEESSVAALSLADRHDFVYAAVGVHPHDAKSMTENSIYALEKLYEERRPLYLDYSDVRICANKTAECAAKDIEEDFCETVGC